MTRPTIGGKFDMAALSQLAGDPDRNRMKHFRLLPRQEQEAAIRRLSTCGYGDHAVSCATGWSVEAVRRVLGERKAVS